MSSRPDAGGPPVLLVSTPKAGHVNQCIAFCEAAGWPHDTVHRVPKAGALPLGLDRIFSALKRKALARELVTSVAASSHVRVVASGASAEHVVRHLRRHFGDRMFAVCVGTPRQRVFDAAICSRHEIAGSVSEGSVPAAKAAWIDGAMVRRPPWSGTPATRHLTVLIGGANRTYDLQASAIATQLSGMAAQLDLRPEDVTLVFSRRTPEALCGTLRGLFPGVRTVGAADRRGFEDALASASHIAVTPDSITMVCEACASGKPVGVFALESHNDDSSAARFVDTFRKEKHISWGRLPEPGEQLVAWNTNDAVAEVLSAYQAWRGSRT